MKTFLHKSHFLSIVFFIANLFFASMAFGQAAVSTDLLDYPPGSTAIITGSGFQPRDTIVLLVEHVGEEPMGTDPQYHQPWIVVADSIGNIATSWYVPTVEEGDALGATFLLTSDGQSGTHADWTFTDAARFKAEIVLTSGNTSSSQTYSIKITNTNTVNTTTKIGSIRILLPTGFSSPSSFGSIAASSGTWIYVNGSSYTNGYNSTSGYIGLKANNGGAELQKDNYLTFTVTVTNPNCAGNYEWTSEAFANSSTVFTGTSFLIQLAPGQPIVTIADSQNPTIATLTGISVNADSGVCTYASSQLTAPTASDNCSVVSVVASPSSLVLGANTVTWTVTDGSNNTATSTQSVTVLDSQNPTITAPSTVSVVADAGKGTASGVTLGTPVTADNCSVANVTNNAVQPFALGNTTVTWTVTGGSGKTATATQVVTVSDNQKPTIVCVEDKLPAKIIELEFKNR